MPSSTAHGLLSGIRIVLNHQAAVPRRRVRLVFLTCQSARLQETASWENESLSLSL